MSTKHRPHAGMRARAAAVAAVLALAAAGMLAAAAAPADAYYLNTTTDDNRDNAHLNLFRFPPKNPGFRPCITRTLRPRPGPYVHGGYVVHTRHRSDADLDQISILIKHRGRYRWKACRGWNSDGDLYPHYEVRSTLRGPRGFFATNLNIIEPYDPLGPDTHVGYGNGYYEWGGRLARDCPGCTSPQD
jgi:hypothetical protein